MSDLFDIQPTADAILASEQLVESKGLLPNSSRFEVGDNDGLFDASVSGGITLVGERSILVQGSLNGSSGNLCHIQVQGDAVITGDVRYARISCRNLLVGGSIHNSQLTVAGDITVASDLVHCRMSVGDYQSRRRRIEDLRYEIVRIQEERSIFDRRISQSEKRLDRSCKATRVPLNFNVRNIISQEHNRVSVNLSTVYSSLGEQSKDKLQKALNEFFAKGIIGFLAKANRKYIADNPAREKVFLQLLKNLRELVMEVFDRDQLIAIITRNQAEIDQLVTELREQACCIRVQNNILPETEIEFALPRVQRLEGNDILFVDQSARIEIQPGAQAGMLRLDIVDGDGEPSTSDVESAELQGVVVYTSEDRLAWSPVAET